MPAFVALLCRPGVLKTWRSRLSGCWLRFPTIFKLVQAAFSNLDIGILAIDEVSDVRWRVEHVEKRRNLLDFALSVLREQKQGMRGLFSGVCTASAEVFWLQYCRSISLYFSRAAAFACYSACLFLDCNGGWREDEDCGCQSDAVAHEGRKEARSNTCDVVRWMATAYDGFLKWRSLSAKRKKGLFFVNSEDKTGCG